MKGSSSQCCRDHLLSPTFLRLKMPQAKNDQKLNSRKWPQIGYLEPLELIEFFKVI